MKSTAYLLTYCVTFGTLAWAATSPATASTHATAIHVAAGPLALGQSGGEKSQSRQEADQWLRRARQAMKAGNLDQAEQHLDQADATGAKYDAIFARFVDTPRKARQDLQRLRQQNPGAAASTASTENALNRLTDSSKSKAMDHLQQGRQALQQNNIPAALYHHQQAAATGATFAAGEDSPEKLAADLRAAGANPQTNSTAPAAFAGSSPDRLPADSLDKLPPLFNQPASGEPSSSPYQLSDDTGLAGAARVNDDRKTSATMLQAARRAVAQGDYKQAERQLAQLRQLNLTYGLNSDSPDRVQALLNQAGQFANGPKAESERAQYAQSYARFLMDQAEGLLAYGDTLEATRLANLAKTLPVQYGQFERTPDQLLARISQTANPAQIPQLNRNEPQRLPIPGSPDAKAQALQLVATAQAMLDRGDLAGAKQAAEQAEAMKVPDTAFVATETRPWELLLRIDKEVARRGVRPAVAYDQTQAGGGYPVAPGVYRPGNDGSRNVQAAAQTPDGPVSQGVVLFQQGVNALEAGDRPTAMQKFSEAWKFQAELDPLTRRDLKDKLTLLRAAQRVPQPVAGRPSPLDEVSAQHELLRQKLLREIQAEQAAVEKMVAGNDPRGGLARLQQLRARVGQSELDPGSRKYLLTLVDRNITSLEQFIDANRETIELDEQNNAVLADISLSRQRKLEMQNKLAELVDQFNKLIDEERFPEAEVIAKQARELAPDEPVVQNLMWKSRFVRRFAEQQSISEQSEEGFYAAMTSTQRSGIPFDDSEPFQIGDRTRWNELSSRRKRWLEDQQRRLSPAEMEIQKQMKSPVDVNFDNRPLSEVMDTLSKLSNVPIYLDPQGMAAEGVTSNTPVTIRLNQQISLKSALNLVLEPLRLSYVIQNEVLRVTSEETRESDTFAVVYNVADLVIPIPNFVPSYHMGLPGAIREAHRSMGLGVMPSPSGTSPLTFANNDLNPSGTSNASVLAQMGATGMLRSPGERAGRPMGSAGMGGGAQADFDSLIELITTTIAPQSWDEVGGPGAIQGFETNLSLVVSQTQEVHEQIADLLDQLRRLQDLQVTIEVRFMTLQDDFFERIGIDFDFDIDDNVNLSAASTADIDDRGPSVAIGLDPTGNPTADLDLSFSQDSFNATVPQFGGFDAATAANFGFAILSDIEVFFLLQAAQGDNRSNVLQAPKVTLFNGQQASVSDTAQRPFVTSVIPVVGDFAAAHQPVIVVLSEGTTLSVQAVVSADRRFVRLTLVPFFSRIGDVQEFTFTGRTTSDTGTDVAVDPDNDDAVTGRRNNNLRVTEGTTVQLPTFAFTTVTTTVSVPDGGTVLLGGIKRLSEGRNERGVPLLSKLPYVNRLFKNVGIGRETQSLMMMVTPRIIIQEEEEEKLGLEITP